MQDLKEYFAEKLEKRELVENEEVGLDAFLDYIIMREEQTEFTKENYGSKIWNYIKATCD